MMDLSVFASEFDALHDKTVLLFSKVKTASDYIGDGYSWQQTGSIKCSVHPVTDKSTVELYGPRVERMMLLHAAPGESIIDNMGVSLGAPQPEYTVVSVKSRTTHTYILIEGIENGSQN